MKESKETKIFILILIVAIIITLIMPIVSNSGLNDSEVETASNPETEIVSETEPQNPIDSEEISDDNTANENTEDKNSEEVEDENTTAESDKENDKEQKIKNSVSMMYYLAFVAEDIRVSRDNRLVLDDIYDALLNELNPGAIDEISQDHLQNLRDVLKNYRGITVKRERLQYIHNKKKAEAIRSAVPNPLAVLSVSQSLDWKKLAISTGYTVVDSYNSYKSASDSADQEFLMSGWELDDEELKTIQKNRERAFNYMVDMVQEYGLDGSKTFSENDVTYFTEICGKESVTEKMMLLEQEQERYELFGNYWLELANCYFETEKYDECLECVEKYNELSTNLYRKDVNYASILPKAIVAAQNTYDSDEYVSVIKEYADDIINNTDKNKDWSTRYFAAQVYLDLYSKTNDSEYLDKAYKIAKENVAVLLDGQRELNTAYLNDVEEVTIEEPNYSGMSNEEKKEKKAEYKEEKKRVNAYNKELKEKRKTELPSLYEPLVLNCELLFALADEKGIDNSEKDDLDQLLQGNVFCVAPIESAYLFNGKSEQYDIEVSKGEIVIPASILTEESKIEIVVSDGDKKTVLDDLTINKVERTGTDVSDFQAHYSSKKWKKFSWSDSTRVSVKIVYRDDYDKELVLKYKVSEFEDHWYGDKVEFEKE